MAFSFRPGLSFYALSIACSVVLTIVYVLFTYLFFLLKGNDGVSLQNVVKDSLGIAIGAFFVSIAVVFLVNDALMPGLCRWSAAKKM